MKKPTAKQRQQKPPRTTPPLTEKQMSLVNPSLNKDWTWFGTKRFRPAPDQKILPLNHIKIIFWGSLQTVAVLSLGLLILSQDRTLDIDSPLTTVFLALVWAFVATHLNLHVYLWNRRAITLQNMAETPLERFYLSQDISIPIWDTIVQTEREKEAEQQSTSLSNTHTH